MTPSNPKPTPSPAPAPKQTDQSKQRLIAIAAVIIVALLAVNAWLLFKYTQSNKAQEVATTQLNESEQLKAELEKSYYEALSELEEMRTGNDELNALIEQQKGELKESRDRIDRMLREQGDLRQARKELASMNQQVDGYVAEINQLREQNALLAEENSQLTQERAQLSDNLNMQLEENATLSEERALLVSEREELSSTNENLSRKVTQASAIKVNNLEVIGEKLRRSGNPVRRRSADNVERLNICFQTTVNEISEPGREEFIVRIVNPQGETLALDQLGSGVFTNSNTGEAMRYTTKDDVDYNRNEQQMCVLWNPGQAFQAGNYTVEVYNKGFLAGSTVLQLK